MMRVDDHVLIYYVVVVIILTKILLRFCDFKCTDVLLLPTYYFFYPKGHVHLNENFTRGASSSARDWLS